MKIRAGTGMVSLVAAGLVTGGASAGAVHVPMYPFTGDFPGEFFGYSVASLGDINADGVSDLLIGIVLDPTNGASAGSARAISGKTGLPLFFFFGQAPGHRLGFSVSSAGDVNNDGAPDILIGAPFVSGGNGAVNIYSGLTGQLLRTLTGDPTGDTFGSSVSGVGDVDADGFDDVLVGLPLNDAGGANAGAARIYSGADGSLLRTMTGDAAGDQFGASVSAVGDVDGDTVPDYIVGARFADVGGNDAGMARVFSGATGDTIRTLRGLQAGDQFGSAVSGAGDLNGDASEDVLVGAPQNDAAASGAGAAYIISVASGVILREFRGDSAFDNLGFAVAAAGDVNGDGFQDAIVGAPLDDNTGVDSGSARVFSGADGAVLYTFNGDAAGDNFGRAVAGAGDINQDGLADLIVGANQADTTFPNAGHAKLFVSAAIPDPCAGDADGNGAVNFADITEVLRSFGGSCP
ncbi:MAG: integrin alpha [Planctomycetota bacterium]|nr:integrin alpha [Planctomycetota bacterium]